MPQETDFKLEIGSNLKSDNPRSRIVSVTIAPRMEGLRMGGSAHVSDLFDFLAGMFQVVEGQDGPALAYSISTRR